MDARKSDFVDREKKREREREREIRIDTRVQNVTPYHMLGIIK